MPDPSRLDIPRALRALGALVQNPDDTAQAFALIESLERSAERLLRRFREDPAGAALLREKPEILPHLVDRDALRAMDEGSLGRAYLAFVESEGISAEGLVEAARAGERTAPIDPDHAYLRARLRDTHDLWHAITGYRGDILGEAALLAFSFAQTGSPGLALLVGAGLLRLHDLAATRLILGGWRRGLRAAWLPAVRWEALLPRPLEQVRRTLGVEPAPVYEPLRTSDLRAMGLLAPLPSA